MATKPLSRIKLGKDLELEIQDRDARSRLKTIEDKIDSGEIGGKVKEIIPPDDDIFPLEVGDTIDEVAGKFNKIVENFILLRNHEYSVGDIAFTPNLPAWVRLRCVEAGTTGNEEPSFDN